MKRKLKVIERYYDNEFRGGGHSEIRLKGKWLLKFGFKPGAKVEVVPEDGRLVIQLIKDG
ncbi:MAG: SymE family type I addiction module toxin [Thermodesulfobacteriota bacterium]